MEFDRTRTIQLTSGNAHSHSCASSA
jgi:hypothetical protein